jgi:hypothetical protein
MASLMFVVVAEEDDYYPDTQTIGVFETEEAAKAYAAAQPQYVYPWPDDANLSKMKRAYSYEVFPVVASPSGDWKPRAE